MDRESDNNTEQTDDNDAAPSSTISAASEGFSLATVAEDAKRVIIDPTGFYGSMSSNGGYVNPAIFVAVMAAILGLLMSIFSLFGAAHLGAMGVTLGSVVIMPIMAVIGSFIAALVMFVIWKLMGSSHNYETAYRCIAYATAIYPVMGIVTLVPYVGTIIGALWGVYLMYTASIQVHAIKPQTARVAMGILAAFLVVTQISTEIASRKMASRAEQMQQRFEKFGEALRQGQDGQDPESIGATIGASMAELENLDQMTPEEAGEKLGKFMQQFERGVKGFEKGMGKRAENTEDKEGEAATE